MKVEKCSNGYKVESSTGGKFYNVDIEKPWCECPAYKFKYMKVKGVCKHIAAARAWREEQEKDEIVHEQIKVNLALKFIRDAGGNVDVVKIIELFGEEVVDILISNGEVLEYKGNIKIID